MTRTFFVHASPDDKKFKQYFPVRYDNDRFQKLSMKFANILNYPHPIEYIVKDKIKDLYREIVDDIDLITAEAPQIRTLFARANVFLMKYSMIIQTVINPDSTEISELAMCQAGDFVKEVVKRMIPIFCEIPTNRDEEKINKVLRFIKEGDDEDTPFITRSKLLRRSHLLARDLDNIIDTLVESKQIYVKEGAFGHVQYHVETMPELTEMAQIRKFLREGK
jgi:hypothetical protein